MQKNINNFLVVWEGENIVQIEILNEHCELSDGLKQVLRLSPFTFEIALFL